jgi:hypothetical protein
LQCVGDLHSLNLKNKSCVLVLPICPQTVGLIEEHQQNLDLLA